jgi:hypothetical protein
LLKNIHHRNYMIRAQAAKALRATGAFDELETLLHDPDPRLRRAALDGLTDYNYWFAYGKSQSRPTSSRRECSRPSAGCLPIRRNPGGWLMAR